IAARHLEAKGWHVLERNFRSSRKEIDLVARRGEVVAFVEVKFRASLRFGTPLEAIDRRKREHIAEAADAWIAMRGEPRHVYRFDAISVTRMRRGGIRIEHLEDAWRM